MAKSSNNNCDILRDIIGDDMAIKDRIKILEQVDADYLIDSDPIELREYFIDALNVIREIGKVTKELADALVIAEGGLACREHHKAGVVKQTLAKYRGIYGE